VSTTLHVLTFFEICSPLTLLLLLSLRRLKLLTSALQSEVDRIARECSESASRRDNLAQSIKDKEQVQAQPEHSSSAIPHFFLFFCIFCNP
jgi:hypothetical protein